MKKTFWILSLAILLFSSFAPNFTYATEAEDEAKQILNNTLNETMNGIDEIYDVAEIENLKLIVVIYMKQMMNGIQQH